ncbi:hypothetical protein BP5796_01337 [Coleophoma crateriformis]|uniref:cyclin-dependent kinase n=1 Tax=Coleophoma crateriformis TaxID=565419 RepID=A0A3D8T049_9HELO|nr:hypothetical protein BP5796_01337 [Coleophoma crateriformis]
MSSAPDWRKSLGAVERYENIQKLKKSIAIHGLSATGTAHKVAVQREAEAYNTSQSKEAYEAACTAVESREPTSLSGQIPIPGTPGMSIGNYLDCHHVASGMVSEVYRSGSRALKVITETVNVEPHNPGREAKILRELSHSSIIKLIETSKDHGGRLILVYPFMPLTLARIILTGSLSPKTLRSCFRDLFSGLAYLHEKGIIHRDVKPSNLLLESPTGPAYLADFGTAWHPEYSVHDEPADQKVLEVGTTCYRAPETLFGNRSYGPSLDIWASGVMLAECIRKPHEPLFESRETSEDGNQLGLILSMFKTLGTPTKESWPEAKGFSTPPFDWYQEFPGKSWDELLPGVDTKAKDLVAGMVRYESGSRLTAKQLLETSFFDEENVST